MIMAAEILLDLCMLKIIIDIDMTDIHVRHGLNFPKFEKII